MRLRSTDISSRRIGNETIVLSLPSSRYFTITGAGSRLLELLGEDVEITDMVDTIVEEYEVDAATARRDIEGFVGRLREAQLLH
jgi:hypothetical protein